MSYASRAYQDIAILYVEDDSSVRSSLVALLSRRFGKVLSTANGEAGYELFQQQNPDIIITDIRLPEMSGLDLAARIKAVSPETPVIVTTAFSDPGYLRTALEIGVDGFIEKPFSSTSALHPVYRLAHSILQKKEIKQASRMLSLYHNALDQFNAISRTNTDGIITAVNKEFCNLTGYSEEELIGSTHHLVRHPETPQELYDAMWAELRSGRRWRGILRNITRDGSEYFVDLLIMPIHGDDGAVIEYFSIRHDITELTSTRNDLEVEKEKYRALALTDPLTGIHNRQHLNATLAHEVSRRQRYLSPVSFVMFDIDHFKKVNDTWGHDVGDHVLITVTRLIEKHTREVDIFCRAGGEEFALIMPGTPQDGALLACEKIRNIIDTHLFDVAGHISCSFGLTEIGMDDSAKDVFKRADEAMYAAKRNGRNRVEVYQPAPAP